MGERTEPVASARSGVPLSGVFPRYAEHNLAGRDRLVWRLVGRVLPRHLIDPIRFELGLARVRLGHRRAVRRYRGASGLLVNVGAGPHPTPGWVNVDAFAAPGIDCVYDCRKSLPFPDGSVRGLFCEHFFEHVDYTEEVPYFLAECRRVLEPGARIRLVVPDFERYALAYSAEGWEALERIRPLEPGRRDPYVLCAYRTKMELLNVIFRQAYQHKFAYDYETLAVLLERHGFGDVRRAAFGVSAMPELALDQPGRASESLYVEAVK